MSTLVPIRGHEIVVQISEDGGTTYTHPVIINGTRSFNQTVNHEEDELVDTSDLSAPATLVRTPRSSDMTVEGQGMAQATAIKVWSDWALTGEAKPCKVICSDATYTVDLVLTNFSISSERAKTAEFSVSLAQADKPTVSATA